MTPEDTPLRLMPVEVIAMTPDEEDRLYTMIGRLIARRLAPDPGHESSVRPRPARDQRRGERRQR